MDKFHVLVIAPEHYEMFRQVLHNYIPDSYDRWLRHRADERANLAGKGYEVVGVEINMNEFIGYCDRAGAKRDIHTLRGIVQLKGTGQPY
jgi:hypothetical protein